MADLEGQWVPRTEAELEFIEGVYAVAGQAHQEGVEQEDIATGLLFVAGSIISLDPEEMEPPEEPTGEKRERCPACEEEIERVVFAMGGMAQIQPCGCPVDHAVVEGWKKNG